MFLSQGGIFDVKQDNEAISFQNAIQMVNLDNKALELIGSNISVDTSDSFAVQKASEFKYKFVFPTIN